MLVLSFLPFICAVLQGIAPDFSKLTGWGSPLGANLPVASPDMPANYVFSMGLIVFALSLIYAVGQLLPGLRTGALVMQLRPFAVVLFALGFAWLVMAQLWGNGWWLLATIWGMWVTAMYAMVIITESEQRQEPFHKWVTRPTFGLYAGWLSVAVWLNVSCYVQGVCQTTFGLNPLVFALLSLTTVVAFSTTILLQLNGCRWYGSAVLWALYAVLWHNLIETLNLPVAIFASVSVLLVYTLLAITPVSRLFRYVRRTRMREWLIRSLAFKTMPSPRPALNVVKPTIDPVSH